MTVTAPNLFMICDEFSKARNTPFPSGFYGLGGAPSSGPLSLQDFVGRSAYINPSVSISPGFLVASGNAGTQVTTGLATANVSNGQAPYSYSWSINGPGWTITNPSGNQTAFRHLADNTTNVATVTITDARGNTAQAQINVSANNLS